MGLFEIINRVASQWPVAVFQEYISYLKIPLRCVLIAFVHDILMNSLNITIELFLKRTRTLGLVSSRGF